MFQLIDLPIELFSIILSFYSQHSLDHINTCCSLELVSFKFYEKLNVQLNKLIWKDLFVKKFIKFNLTEFEEEEINEIIFKKENLNYKQYFIQMKKLIKELIENKEIKIAMFGMSKVGKTIFANKYLSLYYDEYYPPAIEDSFRKIITVDSIPVMLDIYDTTGNDDYRAYREMYARSSSAFLLMCAVSDKKSLMELEEYLEILFIKKDEGEYPVVICVNKVDLPMNDHVITTEIVDNFLREMISKQFLTLKCPVFYTSGKQDIQLNESFDELVRRHRFSNCDTFKAIKEILLNETINNSKRFLRKKIEPKKKKCFLM
ncbi:hypothetical protein ABK040_003009 [Willaertia magna]